jgi:KRAB domain-containing zinc finger protein
MHIRVHTVDKPYECTYCKKKFIQSNNLKTHLRTHTVSLQCDFKNISDIDFYFNSFKGEKPYRCAVCGKSFNQKNNLNTHNRVHTGEKPFECHL